MAGGRGGRGMRGDEGKEENTEKLCGYKHQTRGTANLLQEDIHIQGACAD